MPRDSEWLPSLAQVAETLALIGPHPVARWVYDALAPYAQLFAVEGICAAVRGPVSRHLGLLAAALGDRAAAAAHFAAAEQAARAIGATQVATRIAAEAGRPRDPAARPPERGRASSGRRVPPRRGRVDAGLPGA